MSLHVQHKENSEVYFCTVTCYKWLPLFEEAQTYYSVYRWFGHLKNDGCLLFGFVIIPQSKRLTMTPVVIPEKN